MNSFLVIRREGCSSLRAVSSKAGPRVGALKQWKSSGYRQAWVSHARRHHVSAIVVGAGPAGIAAVGNLLEQIRPGKGKGQGKIAWIDPTFRGGRINRKYREVPSNTKAGLFVNYATALEPFREVCDAAPKPNALTAIQELPQEETCGLRYAGDICQLLTDGLTKNVRVDTCLGKVTGVEWDESTSSWSLTFKSWNALGVDTQRTAPLVVYCTGSSPTTIPLPIPAPLGPKLLDLDVALQPSNLARTLRKTNPSNQHRTIGVIGASHSAILVLMNLVALQSRRRDKDPKLSIRWFTRTAELKYAVYKDGWILHDNTGLKGEAAQFAREQLEGDRIETSEAGQVITRVDCSGGEKSERDAFVRELPGCDYVVEAVGFSRDPLPEFLGGGRQKELMFDHETGGFTDKETGKQVKGLFGAGIAFPERVVDQEGNVEYAVGFWKFMKFLKRAVPEWVATTRV